MTGWYSNHEIRPCFDDFCHQNAGVPCGRQLSEVFRGSWHRVITEVKSDSNEPLQIPTHLIFHFHISFCLPHQPTASSDYLLIGYSSWMVGICRITVWDCVPVWNGLLDKAIKLQCRRAFRNLIASCHYIRMSSQIVKRSIISQRPLCCTELLPIDRLRRFVSVQPLILPRAATRRPLLSVEVSVCVCRQLWC